MVDRTFLKCHIYDCPEDQREAARAALEEWGPWGEYEGDPESPVDGWTTATDIPCDTVPDIATALRAAAPDASWVTWEEPSIAGAGRAIAFTPALGMYDGECDRSGQIVIGSSDFEALRAQYADEEVLITAIDAALGGPWARDYAARVFAGRLERARDLAPKRAVITSSPRAAAGPEQRTPDLELG